MNIKEAIEHRRSINFFDPDKSISKETAENILTLAALAPSSMNLQPWKVITVLSPEKKELLKSVSFNQPKVTEASCVYIVLADKEFIEDNLDGIADGQVSLGLLTDETKAGYINMAKNGHGEKGSAVRTKKAIISTTLFAMNIMYAAQAYGLESHPMGGFVEADLTKKFAINEKYEPVMLIAVGYKNPKAVVRPRSYRIQTIDFNEII
ncbi:MAG: nitroreductase family protein [Deferribacterales bacterium]